MTMDELKYKDGKFTVNGADMSSVSATSIITSAQTYNIISNEEYLNCLIDDNCKIISAIKPNGATFIGSIESPTLDIYIADFDKRVTALEHKKVTSSLLPWIEGKTYWTLGDSTSENTWQPYFTAKTNAINYPDLNIKKDKKLSAGGTTTSPAGNKNGQQRAINLVSYKCEYPIDVLFICNTNDSGFLSRGGFITDKPFMRVGQYDVPIINEYSTPSALETYLKNNFVDALSRVPMSYRKKNMVVTFSAINQGTPNGSKLTLNGVVQKEGDISVKWRYGTYVAHATVGMSLSDIINEFLRWDWRPGCDAVRADENSMIVYGTGSYASERLSDFNGGNTGIIGIIEDATAPQIYYYYYWGDNATDWTNKDKWTNTVTLYSMYKGLFEYLMVNLPTTRIFFFNSITMNVNFDTDYKNPDGSYDIEVYKANNSYYKDKKALNAIQKEVCEYYNIPFLDLLENGNITLFNGAEYFNNNDVHPALRNGEYPGYERYADTMINLI